MDYQHLKYSVSNGVGEIVLNRPEVLNSLNAKMAGEVLAALTLAKNDPTVRALLLTGAGRGFCAGQDLQEIAPSQNTTPGSTSSDHSPRDQSPRDLGEIVERCYNPIILLLRQLEKPVVCSVNGIAAGAGANLAFACDIVLASEKASFVQSFSKVGLIPDSGGTYFLPRLLGLARATALTMLAEKLSAEEAMRIGLVYKVYPEALLLDETKKLCAHLATLPTLGLGLTKRALNQSFAHSLEEQLIVERDLQRTAGQSKDYQEGIAAFLEKRAPKFVGR